MWTFLGWLALFVAVLLAAVIVVNPRREFTGTRFPALQLNTRRFKADLFDAKTRSNPPTGIIIGSSRSMNLQPAIFSSVTGERFFNFGVFNATIEDDLAVARYTLATDDSIRDFVVGIDPQSFASQIPPLAELNHNVRLSNALLGTVGSPVHSAILLGRAYRDALTVSYLADVVKSVRNASHPPEPAYAFSPEGVLLYPKADRERRAGSYDFGQHFNGCIAEQREAFANYDSLGVAKRAMLDSLIHEANARNVRVVLWLPPFNPAFADSIHADHVMSASYQRVIGYLQTLANPPMVTVADENDASRLPSPTGWYDCVHYDSTNAVVIANSLATAVRSANNDNAGLAAAR